MREEKGKKSRLVKTFTAVSKQEEGSRHQQEEGPHPPVYVFLLQGPAVLCESLVRLLPDLLKLILLHSLKEPAHVLLARLQLHPLEMGGEGGSEGGRRTMYQFSQSQLPSHPPPLPPPSP